MNTIFASKLTKILLKGSEQFFMQALAKGFILLYINYMLNKHVERVTFKCLGPELGMFDIRFPR